MEANSNDSIITGLWASAVGGQKGAGTTIKSLLYFPMEKSQKPLQSRNKRCPGPNSAEAEETWQKEMIQIVQSQMPMTGSKGLHVKPSLFATAAEEDSEALPKKIPTLKINIGWMDSLVSVSSDEAEFKKHRRGSLERAKSKEERKSSVDVDDVTLQKVPKLKIKLG